MANEQVQVEPAFITEPSPGDQTELVKNLRSRRRDPVDSDDDKPSGGAHDSDSSDVPGASSLRSIRNVTPFLFFMQSYADVMYPDRKTPERRLSGFRKDHRIIFRLHWSLDFLIQLLLVVLILTGPLVIIYNGVRATLGF